MCTICHNIICPSGCPNCHEHSDADEFSGISAEGMAPYSESELFSDQAQNDYAGCECGCPDYSIDKICAGSYGNYESYGSYGSYGQPGDVMAVCDSCGEPLYAGDSATIIEDYIFCERCIEDATVTLTPQGSAYND